MYFKNKIIDAKTIKENLVGTWSKLYELDDANKALIYLNDDKGSDQFPHIKATGDIPGDCSKMCFIKGFSLL